jgi:hypothetical protein
MQYNSSDPRAAFWFSAAGDGKHQSRRVRALAPLKKVLAFYFLLK